LLKEQDWYANGQWDTHKATRYLKIYKKKWDKELIDIHLELYLNEWHLEDNVIGIYFHIEGKDIELRKAIVAKLDELSKELEKEDYTIQSTSYREPFYKEIDIDQKIFDNVILEINNLIPRLEVVCDKFVDKLK